jgi:hypothetical protein
MVLEAMKASLSTSVVPLLTALSLLPLQVRAQDVTSLSVLRRGD